MDEIYNKAFEIFNYCNSIEDCGETYCSILKIIDEALEDSFWTSMEYFKAYNNMKKTKGANNGDPTKTKAQTVHGD